MNLLNIEQCDAAMILNEDGMLLKNLDHQNSYLCEIAVKQNWQAFEYVEYNSQTPEVCMAAVKQNPMLLEFVKRQTQEICIEAIKGWPWALQYVEKQTEDLIRIALNHCPNDSKLELCDYIDDKKLQEEFKKEISNHLKFSEITADIAKNRGLSI